MNTTVAPLPALIREARERAAQFLRQRRVFLPRGADPIPPHCGENNTRLIVHLPLIVPAGCWFRIGNWTRERHEGKSLVFDDTIEHEVRNHSDELRVVLVFDVWSPHLSEAELEPDGGLVNAVRDHYRAEA